MTKKKKKTYTQKENNIKKVKYIIYTSASIREQKYNSIFLCYIYNEEICNEMEI